MPTPTPSLSLTYAHANATVHTGDLVDATMIARRCGVTPQAVSNWRKRHHLFPAPIWTNGKYSLYLWSAVKEWHDSRE